VAHLWPETACLQAVWRGASVHADQVADW